MPFRESPYFGSGQKYCFVYIQSLKMAVTYVGFQDLTIGVVFLGLAYQKRVLQEQVCRDYLDWVRIVRTVLGVYGLGQKYQEWWGILQLDWVEVAWTGLEWQGMVQGILAGLGQNGQDWVEVAWTGLEWYREYQQDWDRIWKGLESPDRVYFGLGWVR